MGEIMEQSLQPEKIKSGLTATFFLLAVAIAGVLFAIGILTVTTPLWLTIPAFLFVAGGAAMLCCFVLKYQQAITAKRLFIFAGLAFAVLMAVQLRLSYSLQVVPSWDPGGVYISAREYVTRGKIITHVHYFDRFSNNTGLLCIEILYFKALTLLGLEIVPFHGTVLNIFITDAAIFFMFLFVRRIWGNPKAAVYLMISFFFTPYILYMPILYSDTVSMLFVALACYLFACFLQEKRRCRQALLLVLISLDLSFGTKVKGTVAILLVALLLYAAFHFGFKRILAVVLLLIIPFVAYSAVHEYAMEKLHVYTQDRETYKFPLEYWFYLGIDTPGGFSDPIFQEVYAQQTYIGKQEAARAGIKKLWEAYTPATFADHIFRKAKYTYNDGAYFIGNYLQRQPQQDSRLQAFLFTNSEKSVYYRSFANAYHYLLLLLLIFGMFHGCRRRKFDVETMLFTALFGVVLFLFFWETISRYLLNFTPIMIALAGNSLMQIGTWLAGRRQRINERKAPGQKTGQ